MNNSFFTKLRHNLSKTKERFNLKLIDFFQREKNNNNLFKELEEKLLIADIGIETTKKIINNLILYNNQNKLYNSKLLFNKLREEMMRILTSVELPLIIENKLPFIILIVGVNGVGKTTTIAKLAYRYQKEGKTVLLAAGDTFRAAAYEQLQIWGKINNTPVIGEDNNTDSASVIFKALQIAKAKGIDVLIADTAGRLQNKTNLMNELKKIVKVVKKLDIEAPHEIMLILDASIGQNSISQTYAFNEAIKLTGLIITKLDSTAKGGVIFPIADRFNIPIRYIGIGENIQDLQVFKADKFIKSIFINNN